MIGIKRTVLITLAAALVALATAPAQPAMASVADFHFWIDPLTVAVLETDVDTNSSKLEEYRDLGSGFMVPKLALYGASEDNNRYLALRATKPGRADARINLDYGVSGRYAFNLDYNKIPHRLGNASSLIWARTAPGRYEISDAEEARIQSAIENRFNNVSPFAVNFDFLSGLLQPILDTAERFDLVIQRNRTRAKFDLGKMGRMAWTAEYYQENRDGTRPYGGSFGFYNVTEFPEPIAYTTRDVTLGGEWNAEQAGVRFGIRRSTFENDVSTVIWDNPFRAFDSTDGRAYLGPSGLSINGPNLGFADLAPDNESETIFFAGRGRAGGWWFHGGFNYNTMTQDDPLLQYTLNNAIVGIGLDGAPFDPTQRSSLPVQNADTEVDVLAVNGSAGTRFGEEWWLTLRYRYYDYDNGSPRIVFPGYVRYHGVWEPFPRITVPYSYSRDRFGVELGWDVTDTTDLVLTYDLESWDRTFRETGETDEDILGLALNTRPNDKVHLRAAWERGDRTFDRYRVEAQLESFFDPGEPDNQPLLRKYQQAAREYDDYSLTVDLYPRDEWMVTLGLSALDEEYPESVFGLVGDEIMNYNFEVSYTPGANLNAYLFGHFSDRDSFQRARQSGGTVSTNPLDDWAVLLGETNDTFGLGIEAKNDRGWSLQIESRLSDSDGDADFTTPPGGRDAVDFDNYEDIELLTASFNVGYTIVPDCKVGFVYYYEEYTINSFNLVGLVPYLPASLLLVGNDGDFEANIVALYMSVSF